MIVFNLTKNKMVVQDLKIAHSFFERMKGLIGSKTLEAGHGFLIPYCQGVHSFGMSYSIDVLYLEGDGRVLLTEERMEPNCFGSVCFKSKLVLELPAGTIHDTGTDVGDALMIDYGESRVVIDGILNTLALMPRLFASAA